MKKMNNKGFSLVELIIVIAIMAILAGALAPALIKYIAKSRRSSDVSNGGTIQSAMQAALSDEAAYDAASDAKTWTALPTSGSDDFWKVVDDNLSGGLTAFQKIKTTKLGEKGTDAKKKITNGKFYYKMDVASSNVEIAIGDGTKYYLVTPTACKEMDGPSTASDGDADSKIN